MVRPSCWSGFVVSVLLTLTGACERQPRAREREAAAAEAKAQAEAREYARRAAEPLPEEPPVELTRTPNSGLPCDVDEIFARKCRRCHTVPTRHGAPFVFLTWDDTRQDRLGQPLYAVIGRAVRTNYMPYRVDANPPVQPLTEQEKKVILDWVDAGAPRVDCDPNAVEGKKAAAAQPQAAPSTEKPKRPHSTREAH
jgi:hypothetical protein